MSSPLNAKDYYSSYLADDTITQLNRDLAAEILKHKPRSVFEFGAGQGKNLNLLLSINPQIIVRGIDISEQAVISANSKGRDYISLGDEHAFTVQKNSDVSFTCSVLDHIEHNLTAYYIATDLKLMSRKAVILLETERNTPDTYYYYHDYEAYGFKRLDWRYYSEADGSHYNMFTWIRQ